MRTKRRGAVVATAAVAAVAVGSAAWAYYTLSSNTKNATFTARSLSAPTGGTATVVNATTVTVSWTQPASQVPGAQYSVTNTVDGHTVCTVTTTSCSDTAAIPGVLNTYAVKAVLPSTTWDSAAASPSATPPPVFAVTNTSGGALSAQTAGTQFQVRITAMKGSPLAADTAYTGAKSVTFSGPSAAPNTTAPVVNGVTVGTASNVTFANGAATVNATLYRRETAVALTATTGTGTSTVTGTSATFAVNAGPRSALFFTSSSADCSGGAVTVARGTTGAWTSKVSVADTWGNVVANTAAVSVSASFPNSHTVTGTPLSIPANASESTSALSVTTSSGNNVTRLLSATGGGLTAATCSITGS